MTWGRVPLLAVLFGAAATVTSPAIPVEASHSLEELEVVVALNAAGGDEMSVTGVLPEASAGYLELASDVAISLDRPPGSFRTSQDLEGGYVHPRDKLVQADGSGSLRYALDTAKLQLLAQQQGYEAVIVVVCTPLVRQVVDALVAPQRAPYASPGSRCSGWYQEVEEPPIRAVVELQPDRHRYSSAVVRVLGAAAIALALAGFGATLLRRGALKRRSFASWLVSTGAGLIVAGFGWSFASVALWLSGPPADPMLLGGGSDAEQVARTLLPGLVFLVPALLPAAILLTPARREKPLPGPAVPAGPQAPMWWPAPWWGQWAAKGGSQPPPVEAPAPPATGSSGWTPPGSGHG